MGKPENAVESQIVRCGEENGFLVYKFSSPSNRGVPDRLLIGHGLTFFIEAKAPGESLRPLQVAVQGRMAAYGAFVAVMDTKQQVYDFFSYLKAGQYKPKVLKTAIEHNQPPELQEKIRSILTAPSA